MTGPLAAIRANGHRRHRRQTVLLWVAVVLAALGVVAFVVAFSRANSAAMAAKATARALAAEVKHHCLDDAVVQAKRRALDLALLAADRRHLDLLHAELGRSEGEHDTALIRGEIDWLTEVLAARHRDLPPRVNPGVCEHAG